MKDNDFKQQTILHSQLAVMDANSASSSSSLQQSPKEVPSPIDKEAAVADDQHWSTAEEKKETKRKSKKLSKKLSSSKRLESDVTKSPKKSSKSSSSKSPKKTSNKDTTVLAGAVHQLALNSLDESTSETNFEDDENDASSDEEVKKGKKKKSSKDKKKKSDKKDKKKSEKKSSKKSTSSKKKTSSTPEDLVEGGNYDDEYNYDNVVATGEVSGVDAPTEETYEEYLERMAKLEAN